MELTMVSHYINAFGYTTIFLILFCGIVGIPAPEESFLIILGMFIAKGQLLLYSSTIYACLGVIVGMLVAYALGRYAGVPFFSKYGKYVGLTEPKLKAAREKFHKHGKWTILFGLFIPGLRQISPYLAGISHYPFLLYVCFSVIGGIVWVLSFLLLGYFVGDQVHISIIVGGAILFFVVYVILQLRKKRSTRFKGSDHS
ncbi:DedA family protein [Priestia flexa]|uniref:DedA family protein n=1 Tax=Priestia flexa TaxID=86664 RepID=UPI0013D8DCC0|nr:DedA family protein [Priestia flexa]